MENKHTSYDLVQMQSLPLEAKIEMTKRRIEEWYKAWKKYTIVDRKTGKTRHVTWTEEPNKAGCFRKKVKIVDGQKTEVNVMVSGTRLKPTEYVDSCEDGQVYVSFSGGKDSTVLKHIVDSMYPDVPALFINTGLEYPEIQKFARAQGGVIEVRPEMRFDEVLKVYGYPVVSKEVSKKLYEATSARNNGNFDSYAERQFSGTYISRNGKKNMVDITKWKYLLGYPFNASHKCCDVMKKKPSKDYEKQTGRKAFVGTLTDESLLRRQKWIRYGCNSFNDKRPISQPLSFWTEQDVLHYLKKYNVPYCPVYGEIVMDDSAKNIMEGQTNFTDLFGEYEESDPLKTTGCNRTGCIFCMFGCHLEKGENRFQRLKRTHPRQYDYCINGGEYNEEGQWQPSKDGLGLGKVLDYIGVPYE